MICCKEETISSPRTESTSGRKPATDFRQRFKILLDTFVDLIIKAEVKEVTGRILLLFVRSIVRREV
jgi:hypothetical protein